MTRLFFYGTLCHLPLLRCVLGRDVPEVRHGVLNDHCVVWADGQSFPLIVAQTGAQAHGVLLDATDQDIALLDFYEGSYGYALRDVTVETSGGNAQAQVYFADPGLWQKGAPWILADWEREWADVTLRATKTFMSHFGTLSQAEARALWPFAMARAWAQRLAGTGTPTTRRHSGTYDDVQFHPRSDGYEGFFALRRFDLRFRRFDGDWSDQITREGFVAYDAALVLPYDPGADQVLLIEQLRYGPILRGDPHPWVFEPVAGLVDAGEDPIACVRREAQEEAGITLTHVEPIAKVYPSPGYSSEFFHCFAGFADLSGAHGRVAGLASENEDIRSHILSLDDALTLIDSGEINAAPLVMMLYWLARHRDRLRAAG